MSDPGEGIITDDVLAEIEGRKITGMDFRRVYFQQLQAFQASAGGELSEEVLRQLGIGHQVLQPDD